MKKYGIELYNISAETGKDIWIIPISKWSEHEKLMELYERADKLYNINAEAKEICNLIMNSVFYYNYQPQLIKKVKI